MSLCILILHVKLIVVAAAQELIAMTAANLRLNLSTIPHFRVVLALALRRLELVLHLVRFFAIVRIDLVECRFGLVRLLLLWMWMRMGMMVRVVRLNADDFALSSVDFLARYYVRE